MEEYEATPGGSLRGSFYRINENLNEWYKIKIALKLN